MIKNLFKFLLLGYSVIGLLVAFSIKANAAGFSVSIDPPVLYIEANPPVEVRVPITLTNHEDSPVTLVIDFAPFSVKDETGTVSFKAEPLAIGQFIKIIEQGKEIKEIILAPQETTQLIFLADIPKEYQGGHEQYLSIIFSSKNTLVPAKQISQRQDKEVYAFSQLKPGIATNILLSLGSFEKLAKKDLDVDFQTQTLREKGPVDFGVKVTNHAKKVAPVQGEILLQNLFGQTIGRVNLPLVYILAEKNRSYQEISWPETVLFGPYRATIVLKDLTGRPVLSKTIAFLALPYQATLGLIIFLCILLLIVVKVRDRLRA